MAILGRLVLFGVLLLGTGVVLLATLPFVAWNLQVLIDNRLYPSRVFADDVPVERVVSGKRWDWIGPDDVMRMGGGGGTYICTYAVVELADDAPALPPSGPTTGTSDHFDRWKPADAADWLATPMPKPTGGCECLAREFCEMFTGSGLWDRLDKAMYEPGSYYYRSGMARIVYSKKDNIAFRLEETD